MTRRNGLTLVVWTIALAIVLGVSPARADTGTLYVGGNYSYISGGSIDPSYWQPTGGSTEALSYLYCIDIPDHVSAPGTYYNTTVSTDGTVSMSIPAGAPGSPGYQDDSVLVNYDGTNVTGQVAFLLENFGIGNDSPQAVGVQAAIWTVIYGAAYTSGSMGYTISPSDTPALADYSFDLAALYSGNPNGNVGNVGALLWFSPTDTNGKSEPNQALVGQVPDGGMTLMLLGGALVGLETLRRKLRV